MGDRMSAPDPVADPREALCDRLATMREEIVATMVRDGASGGWIALERMYAAGEPLRRRGFPPIERIPHWPLLALFGRLSPMTAARSVSSSMPPTVRLPPSRLIPCVRSGWRPICCGRRIRDWLAPYRIPLRDGEMT